MMFDASVLHAAASQVRNSAPVASLAFMFWLLHGVKQIQTALFFANNPSLANIVWAGVLFIFVYLLYPWVISGNRTRTLRFGVPSKMVSLFIAWSAISLFWTYSQSLFVSVGYWLVMACEVLVVRMMLMAGDVEEVGVASLKGFVAGGVFYGIAGVMLSSGGGTERLGDDFLVQTNFIANYMAFCCFFLVFLFGRAKGGRNIWLTLAAIVTVGVMFRALSKTTLAAFLVSIGFFLLVGSTSKKNKARILMIFVAGGLFFWETVYDYVFEYLYVTQGGAALETLSGRTIIWEEFLVMIFQRPVLGYGFFSVRDAAPSTAALLGHATAHNEWLTIWFTLGWIGVGCAALIYVGLLGAWLMAKLKRWNVEVADLILLLLVFVLIRGWTEAASMGLIFPLSLIVLLSTWLKNGWHPPGRISP